MIHRKYATATHVYMPIGKRGVVDFAVGADWTPAANDVKISIDGGAAVNVTNLPTAIAMGNGAQWDFSLTAAELTGKKITIMISDAATKAIEDDSILIETYGHPSAEYAADFSLANLPANVMQLLGTAWLAPAVAGTPDVNLISAPNSTALAAIGTAVWASGTRTLSSFGTLVADIATAVWAAASRTLTAFGFTVNTTANITESAILTAAGAAKAAAESADAKLTNQRLETLDAAAQETTVNAVSDLAELLIDLIQADQEIDTATVPWSLVYKRAGTQTELLRKRLKTVTGDNLTSTDSIPGRILQ